jgi:ParB-like chromosome segregation protein Spo0J
MPTAYTFHPACVLFPQLGKEELRELADDITVRGLLHDITIFKGQILDGRNRYLACKLASVKPRFVEWQGKGSPVEWVISENLIRRHLTSGQRAVIANDMLPLLEQEAKERQRAGARLKKGERLPASGKASEAAARLAHSSARYVAAVKAVSRNAPELVEKIREGKLSVPEAVALAKLPRAKRQEVLTTLGTANGIAARSIIGDGNHRRENDRYFTPLCEIDALLDVERFPGETLDPCAGDGRIVKRMRRRGCKVVGTDIDNGTDFFASGMDADNIVTNPPWGQKDAFILLAMKRTRRKIALLLPLFALSGINRREQVYSNRSFPLKCVYVISHRLQFDPDANGSSTLVGGWFVWDRKARGEPVVRWLP